MSNLVYCSDHEVRITESGVTRFTFDTLVIFWAVQTNPALVAASSGLSPSTCDDIVKQACALCYATEDQIISWMRTSSRIESGPHILHGKVIPEEGAIISSDDVMGKPAGNQS